MTDKEGDKAMADLIVIEYGDVHEAEEARLKLRKMQRDYLVDLAEAAVAVAALSAAESAGAA